MVWDQRSVAIVSLTQLVEDGQVGGWLWEQHLATVMVLLDVGGWLPVLTHLYRMCSDVHQSHHQG